MDIKCRLPFLHPESWTGLGKPFKIILILKQESLPSMGSSRWPLSLPAASYSSTLFPVYYLRLLPRDDNCPPSAADCPYLVRTPSASRFTQESSGAERGPSGTSQVLLATFKGCLLRAFFLSLTYIVCCWLS